MTQETPETLDRLWDEIPTGAAPLAGLLTAGHAAKRRKRRRVLLGAVTSVVLVTLAAGVVILPSRSQPLDPATPTPSANHINCQQTLDVQRLVITRTILPGHRLNFGFPPSVAVTNPQRITGLISALCALPKFPAGVHNCLNDNGLTYHVDALDNAGEQPWRVEIHASGCLNVQGLRQGRAANSSVWRALGLAMDVHPPTYKSLAGASSGMGRAQR